MICKSFVGYIKAELMYAKPKEHELWSIICTQQNNLMTALQNLCILALTKLSNQEEESQHSKDQNQ